MMEKWAQFRFYMSHEALPSPPWILHTWFRAKQGERERNEGNMRKRKREKHDYERESRPFGKPASGIKIILMAHDEFSRLSSSSSFHLFVSFFSWIQTSYKTKWKCATQKSRGKKGKGERLWMNTNVSLLNSASHSFLVIDCASHDAQKREIHFQCIFIQSSMMQADRDNVLIQMGIFHDIQSNRTRDEWEDRQTVWSYMCAQSWTNILTYGLMWTSRSIFSNFYSSLAAVHLVTPLEQ